MARRKTLSGEVITVTDYSGTDVTKLHWFLVEGSAQGVIDYLNENNIPEHKVKHFSLASSVWSVWFHK